MKGIEEKGDAFVGPWQCVYEQGRSCTDMVPRAVVSIVRRKTRVYHRTEIDSL